MSNLVRFVAILVITLGFPLHNLVARVAMVKHEACVVSVVTELDRIAVGSQEQGSPSCKIVGSSQPAGPVRAAGFEDARPPAPAEDSLASWRPGAPDEPPKAS